MPVLGDLECEVVAIGADEIGRGVPAFGGEDGAADGEDEDGKEVGPENDTFLFGEVHVCFDIHLAFILARLAMFG